ncbi:hypothetical protein [Lysinibacillus sp. 38-6]|uniref:hypothetical protein n=1 Tax=Lysinibacillus sp. 38-6 TaxID=3385991 RepID=UPI003908A4BC
MDIKSLLYGKQKNEMYEQLQQNQQDIIELKQQIKQLQSEILQLKNENRELYDNQKLIASASNTNGDISWTEVTSGNENSGKINVVSSGRITEPEVYSIEEIIQGQIGFVDEIKAILEHTAQAIDDRTVISMGDALRVIGEDFVKDVEYSKI